MCYCVDEVIVLYVLVKMFTLRVIEDTCFDYICARCYMFLI